MGCGAGKPIAALAAEDTHTAAATSTDAPPLHDDEVTTVALGLPVSAWQSSDGPALSSVASLQRVLQDTSIAVCVRVRPLNARERKQEAGKDVSSCLTISDKHSLAVTVTPNSNNLLDASGTTGTGAKNFAFDHVFTPDASQEGAYWIAAKPMLQRALDGYNACVVAYGQTGSGKTHTMQGSERDPGVIPRLLEDLFSECADAKKSAAGPRTKKTVEVDVSYVELYNENLRDLLWVAADGKTSSSSSSSAAPPPLTIREEPGAGGGVRVEGCVTRRVDTASDALALVAAGGKRRTVGETNMNAESSRSHAILTLRVAVQPLGDEEGLERVVSKLHLVDLAGSERAKATGATGDRLKEGAKINQSLSALGNVINALSAQAAGEKGAPAHVPYRDSKLTRLLQDALGGNAFTMVVCAVSPAPGSAVETLSSLRFAERAKKVKNVAKVNNDPLRAELAALRREVRALREENAAFKAERRAPGGGTGARARGQTPAPAPPSPGGKQPGCCG